MHKDPRTFLGQGATEYLVLLAVVLIIALVGIVLLGFFPGTASDARIAQNQVYWKSASPIAIVEAGAKGFNNNGNISEGYIRLRNTGSYPIRITKMLGGSQYIDRVYTPAGNRLISDLYYLSPGEELSIGNSNRIAGLPHQHGFAFQPDGTCNYTVIYLCSAQQVCKNAYNAGSDFGYVEVRQFGFEYIEYVEGSAMTKREVGTVPLLIKCDDILVQT